MPVTDTGKKVKSVIRRRQEDVAAVLAQQPVGRMLGTSTEKELLQTIFAICGN